MVAHFKKNSGIFQGEDYCCIKPVSKARSEFSVMSWYFILHMFFGLQVFLPDNRVVILKIPVFKNRAGKTKVFGIEKFISLGGLQNGEKVDKMEKAYKN